MRLTELINELEDLLEQNGDMIVQLDNEQAVKEVDFFYPIDPTTGAPAIPADAIVIN